LSGFSGEILDLWGASRAQINFGLIPELTGGCEVSVFATGHRKRLPNLRERKRVRKIYVHI
jgi:hypothetical protein